MVTSHNLARARLNKLMLARVASPGLDWQWSNVLGRYKRLGELIVILKWPNQAVRILSNEGLLRAECMPDLFKNSRYQIVDV